MTVADRMAVFMDGRIIQVGTPKGIYLQPANVAVAAFIGTPPMNLLPARLESGSVAVAGATLPVAHDSAAARDVILGVRPGALCIGPAGIAATGEFVEDLGGSVFVNLQAGEQRLRARRDPQDAPLDAGRQVGDRKSTRLNSRP